MGWKSIIENQWKMKRKHNVDIGEGGRGYTTGYWEELIMSMF